MRTNYNVSYAHSIVFFYLLYAFNFYPELQLSNLFSLVISHFYLQLV